MKDEMRNIILKLALCPGHCDVVNTSDVCKACSYHGKPHCEEMLKQEGIFAMQNSGFDLETRVAEVLHELGMPASLRGYRYIREAIMMVVQDPDIINAVTCVLYPQLATKFGTTPSRVERAIRTAIEVAWSRGDLDILHSFVGYTVSNTKGKPTNSELIALIADRIRLEMRKAGK